jgi:predicted enzyme related to lactoylglutathione lyase
MKPKTRVVGMSNVPEMPGIAKFSVVALDCPDHRRLAAFYSAITGWEIDYVDEDWAQLKSDGAVTLAFQEAPGHVPPDWPSDDHPQQAHLDFDVADLDVGEEQVLALGARKADFQPSTGFRVYLDPAGHPFCLVLDAPDDAD